MKKQQASLLSFFGKGKKKRQAVDNDNDNISGGDNSSSSSSSSFSRPPARKQTKKILTNNDSSNEECNDASISAAATVTPSKDDDSSNDAPLKLCNREEEEKIAPNDDAGSIEKAFRSTSDDSIKHAQSKKMAVLPLSPATDTTDAIESSDGDSEADSDDDDDDDDGSTTSNNNDSSNTSNSTSGQYDKSEYELLREKNIARNNARLKALGLLTTNQQQLNSGGGGENAKKKKRQVIRKKATASAIVVVALPTRRSSRLKKPLVTDHGMMLEVHHDETNAAESGNNSNENGEPVMELEEEEFTVSPLIEYQMTNNDNNKSSNTASSNHVRNNHVGIQNEPQTAGTTSNNSNNTTRSISTLIPSGPRLMPPSGLNAIYSLQFHPKRWELSSSETDDGGSHDGSSPWLVGAGKSGLIALWDCSKKANEASEDYIEPVISWKGHGGRWIADARFLPPPCSSFGESSNASSGPSRLLTAGNDGNICHWDLTCTSLKTGAPKLVCQSTKKLHASGIFSMDVRVVSDDISNNNQGAFIVTGSKDKTLAISTLDRLNDTPLWRCDFHRGKVGSVCFSSSKHNPLIASASDDGVVAIHDARLDGRKGGGSNGVVAKLEDAHVKPHSAVWKADSDSVFMTGESLGIASSGGVVS